MNEPAHVLPRRHFQVADGTHTSSYFASGGPKESPSDFTSVHDIFTRLTAVLLIVLMGIWPQAIQAQPSCTITQITDTPAGAANVSPKINADGTRVAFDSTIDGNFEIFLFDARTGVRRITNTPVHVTNRDPSINADGTRIAFDSFSDGNKAQIFVFDVRTGIEPITNAGGVFPSLNADGTRVAFVSTSGGNPEIFLFDAKNPFNPIRQITNTPVSVFNQRPSINADGTRVAFDSTIDGNFEIFLFDAKTGVVGGSRQITNTPVSAFNQGSSINADGTRIAFYSNRDGNSEIFMFDTTFNKLTQITNTPAGVVNRDPSISTDGTRITFESDRDGNREIFLFDTTTNELTQITNTPLGVVNQRPSISSDGTVIAFDSDMDGNPEIFLARCVTPLVFIPGIAGSRLDEVGGENIWPLHILSPDRLKKLTLDPSMEEGNIFVSDVIRKDKIAIPIDPRDQEVEIYKPLLDMLTDPLRGRYREYLVEGNPERRTPAGCDLGQKNLNPTLFVFAYDWRKDSVEIAMALKDYIGCIQQFYPNSKVDILAHSMGGLVARRYILDNLGTHNVSKLITIGSPWLGAPKAINVMETGLFIEKVLGAPGFIRDPVLKEHKALAKFSPGVHQLLPSSPLFSVFGDPVCFISPFCEEGWDINDNRVAYEDYIYDQFTQLLNRRFFPSETGTNASDFHEHPGQDDWRKDASGVRYFHIVGLKPLADTIGKVVARRFSPCEPTDPSTGRICAAERFVLDIGRTKGDGTVPIFSTERRRRDGSTPPNIVEDLNAPGAQVRVFVDLPNNGSEHTELTKSREVHLTILGFLGRRRTIVAPPTSGVQRTEVSQIEQEPLPESRPALYLKINGAISVNVADPFGNNTGKLSDTNITTLGNVPGVTEYLTGKDSRLVIIDPEQEYTVTFRSGADPIALEITKATDTTTTMAIRYQDLNIPVGVEGMLKIGPDTAMGVERLILDSDGDGTFEMEVTPTVEVEGADAEDVEAPTIEFSETVQSGKVLVDITAEDSGTGVKDLFYSLDGTRFLRYTGTLSLEPAETILIHAFADDNVGNRSSTVTFQIPSATVTCGGRTTTKVGTLGNDIIDGTNGRDVIHGLSGNDVIRGLSGNDTLCGGEGNDRLIGGKGDDQLLGERGDDDLRGFAGNDRLDGGDGNDRLKGHEGDDKLRGGDGDDALRGLAGTDTLEGGAGGDLLRGGTGADTLDGGPGADKLNGGSGTDSCTTDAEDKIVVLCE